MAQWVKNEPAMHETQEIGIIFQGQEDPLEKEWQLTTLFLPEKSHGQRSLVGYSPCGLKELNTTEGLHTDM